MPPHATPNPSAEPRRPARPATAAARGADRARLAFVAGIHAGGALVADDRSPRGTVGRTFGGPAALLGDLELRLGLGGPEPSQVGRVAAWCTRLTAARPGGGFWARSFDVDPWATAEALLGWRDRLAEAGWSADRVVGAARLDALAALERADGPPLEPGAGERLARVEARLRAGRRTGYASVTLLEAPELWSARWRAVFAALRAAGVVVEVLGDLAPGAPAGTDLGALQRHFVHGGPAVVPRGDGTLVLLRAPTPLEAAASVAALVRAWGPGAVTLVTGAARPLLARALAEQGLASVGASSSSPCRAPLQVLPLALELLFTPRDPATVLQLVTLPRGPFTGALGGRLAGALGEMPGIGGEAWRAAVAASAADTDADALARVASWLEPPGHGRAEGAPREAVLAVLERVRGWLVPRARLGPDRSAWATALHAADAVTALVTADPRERLGLVAVQQLVAQASGGAHAAELRPEEAGRPEHADDPALVLAPRPCVVWADFTASEVAGPEREPFDADEVAALAAAGLALPDAAARTSTRARQARNALMAATGRLVLVLPGDGHAGDDAHPLHDELVARLGRDTAAVRRVTTDVAALLRGEASLLADGGAAPPAVGHALPPLALPPSAARWRLPAGAARARRFSATSLENLVACPLRWVLSDAAGLRGSERVFAPPEPERLRGALGHRLVERLHGDGALGGPAEALPSAVEAAFDAALPLEAATLLLPGHRRERQLLRAQLVRAIVGLRAALDAAGLRVAAVELPLTASWRGVPLNGRLDLVVSDPAGRRHVVDLKWGVSRYRGLLADGRALQLATYAHLHAAAHPSSPAPSTAYFGLSAARLITVDAATFPGAAAIAGPSSAETWLDLSRTATRVAAYVERGEALATGVAGAPPLLEAVAAGEPAADGPAPAEALSLAPDAGCAYCELDALCGRRWEGLR